MAWAVMAGDWFHDVRLSECLSESGAEWYASYLNDKAGKEKCRVVPLYRHPSPTLTDAEREAVGLVIQDYGTYTEEENDVVFKVADTLRKLLERLGGER